jgi:glutamine amidotransferase
MRVGIVDLGFSNAGSVMNMLRQCGVDPVVLTNPDDLSDFSHIVLAGVGAFDSGMSRIVADGWLEPLNRVRSSESSRILGICLGMQLMANRSEEGSMPGLGWINAEVRRLSPDPESGLRVPHMGWNYVNVQRPNPYICGSGDESRFYFVHSYHVVCSDPLDCVATASHGQSVTAAISRDNLFGVQFHPEKSHRFGLRLLNRFVSI